MVIQTTTPGSKKLTGISLSGRYSMLISWEEGTFNKRKKSICKIIPLREISDMYYEVVDRGGKDVIKGYISTKKDTKRRDDQFSTDIPEYNFHMDECLLSDFEFAMQAIS